MIRTDYDISDEDFEKINKPFTKNIHQYVRDNFILEYMAYYIATGYRKDALWAGKLSGLFNGAIDDLCSLQFGLNGDIECLRQILKDKYNLLLTSDEYLEIEEIQKQDQ
mgnify:FL=1